MENDKLQAVFTFLKDLLAKYQKLSNVVVKNCPDSTYSVTSLCHLNVNNSNEY